MTPLDSVDRRLLALLQVDATATYQALAEQVGVSTATCQRRLLRLRAEGLIEAQVAVLSPQALKAHGLAQLQAIVEVTLDVQSLERLRDFEARAMADGGVQQVYQVSAGADFVLVVSVKDMEGYQALAQRLLANDQNVRNVRSYFVQRRSKMGMALPL